MVCSGRQLTTPHLFVDIQVLDWYDFGCEIGTVGGRKSLKLAEIHAQSR